MNSIVHETLEVKPRKTDQSIGKRKELMGWIRFVLLIIAVFVLVRYGFSITLVSGNSMNPTIENGNIVLTNNILYEPERNDIIVFHDAGGYDVVKRVIALPNETVEIIRGSVFVNDVPIEEAFTAGLPNDMPKVVVGQDSYFVMGDNRTPGESLDSRSSEIGPIMKERIKGEYLISIIPFGR